METFDLETTILNVEGNLWTVRDAATGLITFGQTGSGKTSGPLNTIRDKYLSLGFGGIVFCAKPDEAEEWSKAIHREHRDADVLFLSRETFNYLQHEARRAGVGGGQVENVVDLYLEIINIGKDKRHSGGSADEYWQNAVKQLLRNCISVLTLAGDAVNLQNIYKLIISAPVVGADGNVENQMGYCSDLLHVNMPEAKKSDPAYAMALDYFENEFAKLDGRTRSNTVSSFTVTADAMNRGELARCFSAEESSLHLEDIYQKGKILIVDYDVKNWGRLGQYSAAIIKYCFETMIERREDISDPTARPVFLWADECQFFPIEYDQKFQTTARSSRTLTVYATQNLGNLYDGYGKEKAQSLLGNLVTKIFCQNGEFETNEWAAKSIGQEIVRRKSQNFGDSKSSSLKGDYNKSDSFSEGWSEQKDFRIEPSSFASLQSGGPRGQCKVGFVFWQSGRILNNGNTFVRSTIKQRCKRICGARRDRQCPTVPEVGKGAYLGEKRYLLPMDWLHLMVMSISALLVGCGLWMVYFDHDVLVWNFRDDVVITAATGCFFSMTFGLNSLCAFLLSVPGILTALKTGRRVTKKVYPGMPWRDAVLYYLIASGIFVLWFQRGLYRQDSVFVVLLFWFGACALYRFLRESGAKTVE